MDLDASPVGMFSPAEGDEEAYSSAAESPSVPSLSNDQQILALAANEQRIAAVLRHTGELLAALQATDEAGRPGSSTATRHLVISRAKELFSTLDEVQVALREAVAQLRTSRASALPILFPSVKSTAEGILPTGGEGLGLAALEAEREALQSMLDNLRALAKTEDQM